ncbi:hypothetical protein FRC05_004734 [Tulasnella sp. 425]|nr:hypothetical protein FRC05_004734 [Tulasnella sp. 425]
MLKAQLAASEAMVKSLTKEKYEAVDAARRFCKKWQTVQAEVEKLKASALDEDDATPEVAPPSEGVWFAGLTTQPPAKSFESESASCGPPFELQDPQDQQTQGSMEKDEETLVVSPSSEVVSVAGSTNKLQLPEIWIIPPAPLDAESEPVLDSSPVSTATTSSFPTSNYLSPPPRFDSHPTRSQSPQHGNTRGHPQSTSPLVEHETTRSTNPGSPPQASRQALFNRLGLRVSVPHPIRWLRARRQRELIDLEDPLSETPGRKVHNARMRLLQAQANGPAHSRPSFNLASAADLESSMIRVSMATNRPRTEASSANWRASNPPRVRVSPDFLRRSADEIGGESRTAVESAMRSSPLGLFAPSSSREVTPPEEAGEPQPTKNTGLKKLFKKGRSVISRFV